MSNSVEEVRHHINTLNICSCNIGELITIKYDQIRPMCSWKGPSMESVNLGDRYYFIYAKYVGFTTVNWLLYSNCWLWYIQYYLEQGSKVRPIWSHMRPNFSMVRLKKIWGRTGATSGSKRKKLCDSERPISWSKPIRDNEERDPPLIGRGPDIPVYSTSFKNARQNFAIFTGY